MIIASMYEETQLKIPYIQPEDCFYKSKHVAVNYLK